MLPLLLPTKELEKSEILRRRINFNTIYENAGSTYRLLSQYSFDQSIEFRGKRQKLLTPTAAYADFLNRAGGRKQQLKVRPPRSVSRLNLGDERVELVQCIRRAVPVRPEEIVVGSREELAGLSENLD